jgi:Domain of unknown function (DUF4349)
MKNQIGVLCLTILFLSCHQATNSDKGAPASPPQSQNYDIKSAKSDEPDFRFADNNAPPQPDLKKIELEQVELKSPEKKPESPQIKKENETIERKIIKNGDVRFKTKDLKKTKTIIVQAINQVKGYISEESQNGYGETLEERLTVRVPAMYFDTLLSLLGSQAEYFDYKNIHTQDVTQEYIDVAARIKTKKELEDRYRQILKSAGNVKDLMEVERELNDVREEIESAEGRLKYLSNQVAFSTLNITFYRESSSAGYASRGFLSRLTEALKNGWQLTQSLILGVITLWPIILLGFAFYFLFKKYRYKFSFKRNVKE